MAVAVLTTVDVIMHTERTAPPGRRQGNATYSRLLTGTVTTRDSSYCSK